MSTKIYQYFSAPRRVPGEKKKGCIIFMPQKVKPISIGSRVEMFVDDFLVFRTFGTQLKLAQPQPREIVLTMDQPWEGPGSGIYSCVFHDGEKYRMYYRGTGNTAAKSGGDLSEAQYNCLAVSADGIHWERPSLGLVEVEGSADNNIVLSGQKAHNFSPMLDTNPNTPPEQRYKAVAGYGAKGLMAYCSADGIHWEELQKEPVITSGAFDSHNLCLYDPNRKIYRCYSRYFAQPGDSNAVCQGEGMINIGVRSIQSSTSEDFRSWTAPKPNQYPADVPQEQFYTNATVLCPGAEHQYLSFPMRFMSERHKVEEHPHVGLSDAVFMSSRDGVHFERPFLEAWIRPDLSRRNWTQRNYITTWGILETSPEEFSLYVGEHYEWDDAHVRRYTVRRHGFASMNAPHAGGMFVTKPFLFEGDRLHLNYATSAVGWIRVGIVGDATGWPACGYSAEECDVIYGNELDAVVSWRGDSDLSRFRGKPVRLKFEMKDADLYALRFGD